MSKRREKIRKVDGGDVIISVLSSGYGRLHLAQSAEWIANAGVSVKLICGWVPKNFDSWFVRLCSQ